MRLLLILSCFVFVTSCKSSVSSVAEYNQWLNDEENGCIKEKKINGGRVVVKYQPLPYLVMKDKEKKGEGFDKRNYEKINTEERNTVIFLMTVGPDTSKIEAQQKSLSFGNENFATYADKILTSNFLMSQYLSLYVDGVEYKSIGSMVENIYELSSNRNFNIIFEVPQFNVSKIKECLFVFEDPFFNMGKVQFDFSPKDIENSHALVKF